MNFRLTPLAIAVLLLAPPMVRADNECGVQASPGAPDTVTCTPADYFNGYPNGITYASDGDLKVVLPDATTNLRVFTGGINLDGTGADALHFDSTLFTRDIQGTAGALIDVTSETGDIRIETTATGTGRRVSATGTATHGVRATSSGDGDISISVNRVFATAANSRAVEASSNGGDIDIVGTATGSISGGAGGRGISAQTTGAGNVTIDLSLGANYTGSVGGTGVHAQSGTGDIHIITRTGGGGISGSNAGGTPLGTALHVITEGAITIDAGGGIGNASAIGILTETGSQLTTLNITDTSRIIGGTAAIRSLGADVLIDMAGSSSVSDFEDYAGIRGVLDFSALTGSATLNIGAFSSWEAHASTFSGGGDILEIAQGGVLYSQPDPFLGGAPGDPFLSIIDMAGGTDVMSNQGELIVASQVVNTSTAQPNQDYAAEFRFENLESFTNSGIIRLGAQYIPTGALLGTDRWYDDMLAMPGTDFVGTGASRIIVDTLLNNVGQTACDGALRNADGDLPAADCVDLRGGSASGTTEIVFVDIIPGDRGAYNPDGNVIVDVQGGSAEPGAFVMSADSSRYNADLGAIDKGMFIFALGYDDDDQQFKLYGLPGAPAQQLPLLGHAAQNLWRVSTSASFDRGTELRTMLRDGRAIGGGGVWLRSNTETANRTVSQSSFAGLNAIVFDNSYEQESRALNLGVDFVAGATANSAWVVGAMIGYASADIGYDRSTNDQNLEGMSLGLYANYLSGAFYIDAALNGNWMTLDNDVPALELFPGGTVLNSNVESLGVTVESGWRMQMNRIGVEPLAGLTYVTSTFDDVDVPSDNPNREGLSLQYDDPTSVRGSLGVRLSVDDLTPSLVSTRATLTARAISEFDGESKVSIDNLGTPAPVSSTLDGEFTQLTGGLEVRSQSGRAAGYLNIDSVFASDYDSLGVSAGFRYQW